MRVLSWKVCSLSKESSLGTKRQYRVASYNQETRGLGLVVLDIILVPCLPQLLLSIEGFALYHLVYRERVSLNTKPLTIPRCLVCEKHFRAIYGSKLLTFV